MTVAAAGSAHSPIYTTSGLSMLYGGVRALSEVSFAVSPGQVHALLGANGAGKSTLVKILAGVQRPTRGRLFLEGVEAVFRSQREAVAAGIATVSQELSLFPDLSILENLFLMREPLLGGVLMRRSEMFARAAEVLEVVGLGKLDARTPLRSLSLSAQQLVEIARALLEDPRVLILDEPTSAQKAAETHRLLGVVEDLRRRNVAVVFVSHFIEDVFKIADVITVLRNGRVVENATPCSQLTPKVTIQAMVGNAAEKTGSDRLSLGKLPLSNPPGDLGPLILNDVLGPGLQEPLGLTVEPGEVVGLAGLEDSGASETLRLVFGHSHATTGKMTLPSGRAGPRNKAEAVKAGIAYVPADRKKDGLILKDPIYENVSMVTAGPLRRRGFLPRRGPKLARVEDWRKSIGIAMPSPVIATQALSGGNQQKVVFAKWLETNPSLILLDDPTRGVDVATKADMIKLIRGVAESGRVVLYTSSDLQEMTETCDRIVVFYRGAVAGELFPPLTEHRLLDSITTGTIESSQGSTLEPPMGSP